MTADDSDVSIFDRMESGTSASTLKKDDGKVPPNCTTGDDGACDVLPGSFYSDADCLLS